MGLGGISFWQLLIVLIIIVLLFGTKKLKNLGSDLGGAVRGFKKAVKEGEEETEKKEEITQKSEVIEGKVESKEKENS